MPNFNSSEPLAGLWFSEFIFVDKNEYWYLTIEQIAREVADAKIKRIGLFVRETYPEINWDNNKFDK
jgi:hypothetical protein